MQQIWIKLSYMYVKKPIKQQIVKCCSIAVMVRGIFIYAIEMISDIMLSIHAKIHDCRLKNANSIKASNSTVWEAGALVLLRETTFDIFRWEGFTWYNMHTNIMKIGIGVQAILRSCISILRSCKVGIADELYLSTSLWGGLKCHNMYTVTCTRHHRLSLGWTQDLLYSLLHTHSWLQYTKHCEY
jgi:hypothetical protein